MSQSHKENLQIIYGRNPIIDAFEEGKIFERVYIRDSLTGDLEKEIRRLCKKNDVPLKKVPNIKLDQLSRRRNHQGVVGLGSLVQYQDISMVIPFLYENGVEPLCVLIDNVQDTRNIGAIARSLEVLGGHCLILCGKNAGMITHDSLKVSAGALTRLHVSREKNTINAIEKLRSHGLTIVGTSLNSDVQLSSVTLSAPICIVMGSENTGLHYTVESACDKLIHIPQVGKTDSLNVSVSAGVILYEILRQKMTSTS